MEFITNQKAHPNLFEFIEVIQKRKVMRHEETIKKLMKDFTEASEH